MATSDIETLEAHILKERERLAKVREEIIGNQQELETQLGVVDARLAGLTVCEDVLAGKASSRGRPWATRTTESRAARKEFRAKVLEAIKHHPAGISRVDLHKALNATEEPQKKAVDNAVSALKRMNQIIRKDRKYVAT
jgi:hypothetical protein